MYNICAPTGSVSILTQTSSGLEPLFMPYYMRRKKVNPNDTNVKVDFTDQNGDTWQEFPILHPKFKDWVNKNFDKLGLSGQQDIEDEISKEGLQKAFEQSPWYGSTANDIDWVKRVEVQGIIQKYISHSISSTINLPENVSEDEVSTIYLESWKQGLKGVTVYREGSRSGVLVDASKTQTTNFEYKDAPKRPKSLPCDIYTTVSKGVKWNVIVGLLDNKPYEVFAVPYFTSDTNLNLVKVQQKEYNLQKEQEVVAGNITAMMTSEEEVITRLISTSLRHGADIKFIVEQLNKSHGDITSFNKAIARNLKKYIPDGAKATVKCRDCGSDNVIFEEGCHKCLDCGSTACG